MISNNRVRGTCVKELEIYCTYNLISIAKRTYWLTEQLYEDVQTSYHYQHFMGRHLGCTFKECNPKENFTLHLLLHLALCLIAFVCIALLIMIITS